MAKKKLNLDKKMTSVFDKMAGSHDLDAQLRKESEKLKTELSIDDDKDTPTFKKHNAGNRKPYELSADGRKRFTTMMTPKLKSRLQAYGNEKGLSVADIIEISSKGFLDERGF